jgi:glutamate synthase domain-containing protein 3
VIVAAYQAGWKRVIAFDWRGQRFCGSGLGPHSDGFRLDVYGNPGDYLGSGLDGAEIYVHSSAQDQVAQIMKSGKLVIYGDVGQTFMYAAKGGEVYVLGNAAGRPLINAVGHPKVVINGTCLDYLAESFMAGDPLDGGGFAIVNGVRHHENGKLRDLATPYPGSNLFSLASGGAIYVRDPLGLLDAEQLNGGRLVGMTSADWQLIQSHLKENEELFGIRVNDLLKRGNDLTEPSKVYRKVEAVPLKTLAEVH